MTTADEQPTTQHAHAVSERIGPGSVSVARIGPRMYEGLNERGATLRVGGPELEGEHFTPGELLKLALISCSGLSADRVTARRLGDDFVDRFAVAGPAAEVAERLAGLAELGLDRLIVVPGSVDADPDLVVETNAAFAAAVLPALR